MCASPMALDIEGLASFFGNLLATRSGSDKLPGMQSRQSRYANGRGIAIGQMKANQTVTKG